MRRPRIRIRWRKRTSRWVIGAAVLFFLSLLALQLVMMNYTKSILQNVLNLQLQQASNGAYISSFDDIEISYTRKNFVVRNLRLVSRQQDSLPQAEHPNTYDLLIPEVQINGINLRKAYLQNFLDIESLQLINPSLQLHVDLDAETNKTGELLKEELYKLLPNSIDGLRIGQVQASKANIHLVTKKKGHKSELIASSVEIELNNFFLDAQNPQDQEKIFFADHFFVEADSMKGVLSDSLYHLQVGSLKISSKDSSAFMSRFSLQPVNKPQEVAGNTSISNLYALDFPQVYLYGLSFPALYHHKDLLAKEVTVISPNMKLYNLQPPKAGEKENFRLENLYPVIDKLLNSLQIQDVYLRNGQLQIDELKGNLQHKLVSEINLAHVHNFQLDSTASQQKNKLFYSDDLSIQLQNYSLRLSDNLHLLMADKLAVSSEQDVITAEGFKILPDSGSSRLDENLPLYRGDAALINISGVNLLRAYNDNHLFIDSLLVMRPTFRLSTSKKEKDPSDTLHTEGFKEEDLYGLIKNYLYTLQINKIALKQGHFQIRQAKRPDSDAFITKVQRAQLWNFRLDSASAYQMNKLFYANDFELEIADYSQALPDDIHTITAAKIGISTLSDHIIISDVRITPLNYRFPYTNLRQSPVKTLLQLEVPELRLEGVDILKAYLQKQLDVEQVFIPSPVIALGTLIDKQSERMNIIKSSALYDLMKEYLELIQVRDLHLQKGSIDLAFYDRNGKVTVSGEQTGIQIDNFRFDSLTSSNPKRLFFADNVRVEVAGYETRLSDNIHIIRAENVVASTSEQEIKAENVAVNTTKENYTDEELLSLYQKKGYVQLLLPELRISGVNFDEAYYKESLQVDSVLAGEPLVHYTYIPEAILQNKKSKVRLKQTEVYEGLAPYLKEITVDHLYMKNGHFYSFQQQNNQLQKHIALEGLSLDLQDFHVDSAEVYDNQRFFYTQDIRLQVNGYQQELPDKEHRLTAENLFLSTAKNKVRADNIRLQPKQKAQQNGVARQASNNQYFIFLPALDIEGIQFDDIFRENRLFIEDLSLQNPSIKVEQYTLASESETHTAEKSKLKDYKLSELLQGNLKSFTVKEVNLIEGKGTYTLFKGKKKLQLRSRNFKAKVDNFHLEEGQGSIHKPFYADNIQINFSAIERPLSDSLHMLTIDEISYSSQEKLLQAEGISLKPRVLKDREEQMRKAGTDRLYTLHVPLSQLKGLEAEKLDQDSLFVEYMLFRNPTIEIVHYPALSVSKEATEENQSWQRLLKKEFELLQADSILVKNASAVFHSQGAADTSQLNIRNIDAVAYNFRFDSLAGQETRRLLFSDKIKVQAQDYYTTLEGKLYELHIKEIQLDSDKGLAVADSISITPIVSREEFAEYKGYETDQFTFRNRQLRVENLDYYTLLKSGSILADSLLLDGFYLLIHRDKRQPYPKDHYPKMPQDLLRNLDTRLMILGVALKDGYIGYSERAKGTREPGFIDLTDFRIVSDTITNHPELLKNGVTTNIHLQTYLMGTGNLNARFEIPLNDPLNRHYFAGTLNEMYLPDFNPILENTVFIKIRDGHASYINFAVNADKYGAEGEMEFRYSDLRVALVNRKTGKTGGLTKEIGSIIANLFVVNSSNLEENNKTLRKGKMEYERDENRSTLNYWIKTLVNGFKSSIGI